MYEPKKEEEETIVFTPAVVISVPKPGDDLSYLKSSKYYRGNY